ncbi:hypothetical protein F4818DRAFT_364246 [Hypoxylon cercidicola]|nr:hypothetical protein F4818DRAFT_364246 [Hypoxylon cercidicola]
MVSTALRMHVVLLSFDVCLITIEGGRIQLPSESIPAMYYRFAARKPWMRCLLRPSASAGLILETDRIRPRSRFIIPPGRRLVCVFHDWLRAETDFV